MSRAAGPPTSPRVLLQFVGNKHNAPEHGDERPSLRVARMPGLSPLSHVFLFETKGDDDSARFTRDLAETLGKNRRGALKVSPRVVAASDVNLRSATKADVDTLLTSLRGEFGARLTNVDFIVSAVTGTPAQWTTLVDALDTAGARVAVVWDRPDDTLSLWRSPVRGVDVELTLLKHAPAAWNVLLTGPTGVGKSHTALRLHDAWREHLRRNGAFQHVNAGAIPRELIEATLFGHEKGAFTGATGSKDGAFQAADGGTLFLDEIGDLPLDQQVRLLTALDLDADQRRTVTRVGGHQARRLDLRLVFGTNRDLYALAREGRFRLDLLGRISTHALQLPPLTAVRHRIFGVYLDAFERLGAMYPKQVRFKLHRDARRRLIDYAFSPESRWPWNLRDVHQSAERLCLRAWAQGHGERVAGVTEATITVPHVARELDELRTRESTLSEGRDEGWASIEARVRPEAWERMSMMERWELRYLLEARDATSSMADAWRWIAARNLLEGSTDEASQRNPSNAFDKRWRRYASKLVGETPAR